MTRPGLALPVKVPGTPASLTAERLVKTLDADALRHNVRLLHAAAGRRQLLAVVKGDAYGMGAVAVSRLLADSGVAGLAVDTVAEGAAVRAAGCTLPILVMDVDVAENAADCLAAALVPSVAQVDQVDRYAAMARRQRRRVAVWLRTNVGFNRFGPRGDAGFAELLGCLHRHREQVQVTTLFAHLSSAAFDEEETSEQAHAFRRRLALTRSSLGQQVAGSLVATHGLMHRDALRGTQGVRVGLGLYGLVNPASRQLAGWPTSGLAGLRPAVEVRARVLDIVAPLGGEGVGYDRSSQVAAGTRLASVAIGFSRGVTAAGRGITGLLHGQRCAVVGLPGMDCTQFDVTSIPQARPGDWVTFIGASDGATKTVDATCAEMGCSSYELLAVLRMPVQVRSQPEQLEMDGERSNSCRTALCRTSPWNGFPRGNRRCVSRVPYPRTRSSICWACACAARSTTGAREASTGRCLPPSASDCHAAITSMTRPRFSTCTAARMPSTRCCWVIRSAAPSGTSAAPG
jgi:alanine racemase